MKRRSFIRHTLHLLIALMRSWLWQVQAQHKYRIEMRLKIERTIHRISVLPAGDERAYWLNRLNEWQTEFPAIFRDVVKNTEPSIFERLTVHPVENAPRRPDPYYRPLQYLFA